MIVNALIPYGYGAVFLFLINTLTLHIIPCFSTGYVSDPCDHDRCCDCSLPDSSIHRKAKSGRCRPAPGALWVSNSASKLLFFVKSDHVLAAILGRLLCKVVAKCIGWRWQLPDLATCFLQGIFWSKSMWSIQGLHVLTYPVGFLTSAACYFVHH